MPTRENEHIQHIFFWSFGLKKLLNYLSGKNGGKKKLVYFLVILCYSPSKLDKK